MKLPSHPYFPQGRRALVAATLAILFGAGTALAQSSTTGSSSGSATKPSDTTRSGSSDPSSTKPSDASSHSTRADHSSAASGTSATQTSQQGGGAPYQSRNAGDVDATTEINAQAGATGAGAATGRTTSSSERLGWGDRRFVTKAADAGQAELHLAQLATERASNSEVKAYAQKIVDDHGKVNEELKTIASQKNVKLDDDDDKDRSYKRLSKKSGTEFDQEFVEHMIDEHEKDIRMFEKAAKDAKDAEIRSFAAKHVDHLREHLQQAQSLRQTVMPTGRTDDKDARSTSGATRTSTDTNTSSSSGSSDTSRSRDEASSGNYGSGATGTGNAESGGSATPKRDGSR